MRNFTYIGSFLNKTRSHETGMGPPEKIDTEVQKVQL